MSRYVGISRYIKQTQFLRCWWNGMSIKLCTVVIDHAQMIWLTLYLKYYYTVPKNTVKLKCLQHTSAVTMVKFAHNDRSRLCCASNDGTVSICNVTNSPPTVDCVLSGHKKAVTGESHLCCYIFMTILMLMKLPYYLLLYDYYFTSI